MGHEHRDACSRRVFLTRAALAVPLASPLASPLLGMASAAASPRPVRDGANARATELTADLVIIGGGLGGCAAALAAARHGLRVIMTEETDWIGGQLTQQGVPPDENAWIESIGGTRSYLSFRAAVREFYRQQRPLTVAARSQPRLNPGNGWVSRLCAEPRVFLAVLEDTLAPYVASGQLTILRQHRAVAADATAIDVGRRFGPGADASARVSLALGAIELAFDNGIEMVLEGPCELEIVDAMRATLLACRGPVGQARGGGHPSSQS